MSWARLTATGSGLVNFRLQIEGFPYEPVTDRSMEGTATDGRKRYAGLDSSGIRLKESIDLLIAKWSAEGFRIRLVDRKVQWTEAFRDPTAVTYLDTTATGAASTLTVKNAGAFAASGQVYVDTETVKYTTINTAGTSITGLTRGHWSSLAQTHYTADGARQRFPEITNWPRIREGRRVKLYAYGAGDDIQDAASDAGQLIWTGVVSTEPSFDGMVWSFNVDPISRKWDQDLGGDLEDPKSIRGIYYPDESPLVLWINESSSTYVAPITSTAVIHMSLAGFWEDQAAFVVALQAAIDALSGSFTQTITVRELGPTWCIEFETTGASPHGVFVQAESATDFIGGTPIDTDTGTGVGVVSASSRYRYRQNPPLGVVPRTTLGHFNYGDLDPRSIPDANRSGSGFPWRRIYLSGSTLTSSVSAIAAEWESNGADADGSMGASETLMAEVATVDTTNRYIELNTIPAFRDPSVPPWYSACGSGAVEIRFGRTWAVGDLDAFVTGVTADTAAYLNTGATPDVRSTDFTAFASTDVGDASLENPLAANRVHTLYAPVSFRDYLEQECRLLGVYPCYASDGTVTFRRLRLPIPSEVGTTITAADIITGDGEWLSYEVAPLGMVNTVTLATYYDALQEEHTGHRLVIRDVESFGRNPDGLTVDIEPYSRENGPTATVDNALNVALPLLSVFGGTYAYLKIRVKFTLFSLLLGDVVDLTWDKVPNPDGTMGVTNRIGIVVAREWDFSDASGSLTLLLTSANIAGYVPAAKLASIAGASGGTGPFTANAVAGYFGGSDQAADHWNSGDKIRVFLYDAPTSGVVTGTLNADPVGDSFNFSTDAAWTYVGSSWALGSQISTSITAAKQKLYCFIANTDGTLDFSGDTGNDPQVLM